MNEALYAQIKEISLMITIPRKVTGDDYNTTIRVNSEIRSLNSSSAIFTFHDTEFCFSSIFTHCIFSIPSTGEAVSYDEDVYDLEDILDELSDKLEIDPEDGFVLIQISNWLRCLMAVYMV